MTSPHPRNRLLASAPLVVGLLAPFAASAETAPDEPLLPFSTYLGGNDADASRAAAFGPDGVLWIAATTSSDDFPGAPRPTPSEPYRTDVVVIRLDPATRTVLSTVRLGGSGGESVCGLAVGADGDAFVAGDTSSPDFPYTVGALGTDSLGRARASFVVRLRADGSGAVWVRAFGGSDALQWANGLCLTSDGDPLVVGTTAARDFPVVAALDPTFGGTEQSDGDGFVARFRADGTGTVFSTYLGGSATDGALSVCLAPDGSILVTGQTSSADFVTDAVPILGRPTERPPFYSCYLAELDPSGSELRRVALCGAAYAERIVAGPDSLIVVGTGGANSGLPFPYPDGSTTSRWFLARLDSSTWETLGGRFLDPPRLTQVVQDVALSDDGTLWIASAWTPDRTDLPLFPAPGAVRPHPGSQIDAYVAAFRTDDFRQVFGTYLGGGEQDYAATVAVAPDGAAWVAGWTRSADFPTASPLQPALATSERYGSNLFVAQLLSGDPGTRPEPVTDLAAAPLDARSVRIAWSTTDDRATLFGIDRSDGAPRGTLDRWTRVAVVPGQVREWIDRDLDPEGRHRYTVQAISPGGGSPVSATADVTTPPTLEISVARGHVINAWRVPASTVLPYDRCRLRGTLRAAAGAAHAPDPRTDGMLLILDNGYGPVPLVSAPPGDRAWRRRRDGVLVRHARGTRVEFDPRTGRFDVLAFIDSELAMLFLDHSTPVVVRVRVGDDAGSTSNAWGPVRGAPWRWRAFRRR